MLSTKLRGTFSLLGTIAVLALGCSPESPKLVELPLVKKEKVKNIGDNRVTFNRMVDILFVIDDSGSMSSHQKNLANGVKQFITGFSGNQLLDYHIGVVTSDTDDRPNVGSGKSGALAGNPVFITRQTPNGYVLLEKNLQPGTGGSATERFFDPVQLALTPPNLGSANAGFYRDDAYLVIIFVTDAEEQSKMSAKDFFNFVVNLKRGDQSKVIQYAAYVPSTVSNCPRDESTTLPAKLEDYFKMIGGKGFNLCDPDFGKQLALLGDDLSKRVGSTLVLSRPPQPDTIVVRFGTQTIPNDPEIGWIFDPQRNALIFGKDINLKPEPPGTQVEVDFIAAQY